MKFLKVIILEHSGIGKNATHIQIMNEFRKSKKMGFDYCEKRGFNAEVKDGILTVEQSKKRLYGFKMMAKVVE